MNAGKEQLARENARKVHGSRRSPGHSWLETERVSYNRLDSSLLLVLLGFDFLSGSHYLLPNFGVMLL